MAIRQKILKTKTDKNLFSAIGSNNNKKKLGSLHTF